MPNPPIALRGRDYTAELTDFYGLTRDDVARTYALALGPGATADWQEVNQAIIGRWSKSGLHYIKHKAWKLREAGEVRP